MPSQWLRPKTKRPPRSRWATVLSGTRKVGENQRGSNAHSISTAALGHRGPPNKDVLALRLIAARQVLKTSLRFSRAEIFGFLVPASRHRDVGQGLAFDIPD